MNLTIIAAAISAALAGSIGFGAAWTIQGRTIDALRIEAKDAIIIQQRAAREAVERASDDIRKAQTSAANRIAVLNRELAAVGSERDRLRDTSTIAVRTATSSPATCGRITTTFDLVFAECSGSLQTMAATLDQCVIERQTLMDAWPR